MTDLSQITIEEIWKEFRKRGCAVIIVQPETLKDLHPTDAEEIAWFAIERELERREEEAEHEE